MKYQSDKIVFNDGSAMASAVSFSNAILSYRTLAEAESAKVGMKEGQIVDIESTRNQYKLVSGSLVLQRNLDQLGVDLSETTGSSLIGYDGGTAQDVLDNAKPMQSYTALRAYTGRAIGTRITAQGISGVFQRDALDTTSIDNGGTTIVDASGRRWKRLYKGRVDVLWFGADPSGVSDSTAALLNAFTHSSFLLMNGIFKTSTPITLSKKYLNILAVPGSSVVYSGAVGSTWVMRFNDLDALIFEGQMAIDCDGKSGIGLEVRGAPNAALVDIKGVTVFDCTHSAPSTSGASGIQVLCDSGMGKVARVTGCSVFNVTRTTGDGLGAVCSGISVNDFDVMVVESNNVDRIYKGNGTVDADGIKVFSQLVSGAYSTSASSIRNNRVTNCEGRWVKSQTRGKCGVEDNYFAITIPLDLITSFRGVDAQVGDTLIQNNKAELLSAWTGGEEMHMWQVQFNSPPEYAGQKIEHSVLSNSENCDG